MRKITHEELGAEALIPDITGRVFADYQQALREHKDEDALTRSWKAALCVVKSATVTQNGEPTAMDESTSLKALLWVAQEVQQDIEDAWNVPKNSSAPPSTPDTTETESSLTK